MEAILAALADQQAELAGMLDTLDPDDWDRPSACAGWSIADVALHLAQTNEMATGSARGDLATVTAGLIEGTSAPADDIDQGAAHMVANQRGAPSAEVHTRWARSSTELLAALRARAPGDRLVWVAGELAARTLATTRLAETWIHTGDIAAGLGVQLDPTDRLWHVARLAWRTIPYAFERAGLPPPAPVAFELVAPSSAWPGDADKRDEFDGQAEVGRATARKPGGDGGGAEGAGGGASPRASGSAWSFRPDVDASTVVRGTGHDLCRVASRRVRPGETTLVAEGPDGEAVLSLLRTWA